jgi:hypothetical protein
MVGNANTDHPAAYDQDIGHFIHSETPEDEFTQRRKRAKTQRSLGEMGVVWVLISICSIEHIVYRCAPGFALISW